METITMLSIMIIVLAITAVVVAMVISDAKKANAEEDAQYEAIAQRSSLAYTVSDEEMERIDKQWDIVTSELAATMEEIYSEWHDLHTEDGPCMGMCHAELENMPLVALLERYGIAIIEYYHTAHYRCLVVDVPEVVIEGLCIPGELYISHGAVGAMTEFYIM